MSVATGGVPGSGLASALDGSGNLYVVYIDTVAWAVRYLKRTGSSWGAVVTLDTGTVGGLAMAVDSNGKAHVTYLAGSNNIRYAAYDGHTITGPMTVGTAVGSPRIVVDGGGNPVIAVPDCASGNEYVTRWNGSGFGGLQVVDNVGAGNCGNGDIVLDGQGRANLIYGERSGGYGMKFASQTSTGWAVTQLKASSVRTQNMVLALDGSGEPQVVYWGSGQGAYNYFHYTAGAWSGDQTIDASTNGSASIAMDGSGDVHVSYYAAPSQTLKYGVYNGVSWSTQTVDSSGSAGYASNVVMVDGSGNVDIVYDNEGASQIDVANWAGAGFAPAMGGNPVGKVQAPSGFSASAVYQTSVTWTWTDNAVDALGYRVYGGTSATGSYSLVASTATLGSAANSYTQTGLTAGTSYFAYAAAVNAGGVVVSSGATVMTAAAPVLPVPGVAAFTSVSSSALVANWTAGSGNLLAGATYLVQLSTNAAFAPIFESSTTLTMSATFYGLSASQTYYAEVQAATGTYVSAFTLLGSTMTSAAAVYTPFTISVATGGVPGSGLASALDGSGNLYVVYIDTVAWAVRYLKRTGSSWGAVVTLDTGTVGGLAMAVDSNGKAHVTYLAGSNNIRYAAYDGHTITGPMTVGTAVGSPRIVVDGGGNPVIAFPDCTTGNEYVARWNGSGFGGLQVVDNVGAGNCGDGDIALDGQGRANVIYGELAQGYGMKYASQTSSGWAVTQLKASSVRTQNMVLALDGSGEPQVVYWGSGQGAYNYFHYTAGAWSGDQTIDASTNGSASIAMDGTGDVHVS